MCARPNIYRNMATILNESKAQHTVQLDGRKKAAVHGVTQVIGMSEALARLRTSAGGLSIFGSGMHMAKYNADEGFLVIDGKIDKLQYSGGPDEGGHGLLKRIFK